MTTATLWGIGCYEDGTTRVPWEISHDEIQRDMAAAGRTVEGLGIGAGDRVLFCSMLSEAGQFWPLIVGAMLRGAQLSCADANEGDAVRVAMFTRLVHYDAVLGITGAILDGLDVLGKPYGAVFRGMRVLGARPDAYARLEAAGLAPQHFVLCGPAVATATEPGAPARADVAEWQLDVDAGRVLVTSRRPRATTFRRSATGVRAAAVDTGIVPENTGRRP
jgi:hypothetical protein